jgi:hypothetical protein
MDRALLVHGAVKAAAAAAGSGAQQQPTIRSLDINVDEHVNASALAGGAGAGAGGAPDFAKLFKDLPALLSLYDSALLDPLLPKPPAAEAQKAPAMASAQPIDPLRVPPRECTAHWLPRRLWTAGCWVSVSAALCSRHSYCSLAHVLQVVVRAKRTTIPTCAIPSCGRAAAISQATSTRWPWADPTRAI